MDAWMRTQRRETAASARKGPAAPHRVTVPAGGDGSHGPEDGPRPTDLFLEATHPTGEVTVWFDDAWWLESLRRWGDEPLVIHILPSRAAVLHPVVLHQVAMVKRVAPNWRVVGYGYSAEISGDAAIERLADSAYDEVRFMEGLRPNARGGEVPRHSLRIEDLFGRVRRMERQRCAARPVLVRAKSLPQVPGDAVVPEVAKNEPVRQAPG